MNEDRPVTQQETVRLVIVTVGLSLLICLLGSIVLTAMHVEVPGLLGDIAKTGLGLIGGTLISTSARPANGKVTELPVAELVTVDPDADLNDDPAPHA